ncbi:MAG: hypothetical protein LBG42_01805, partial [Treponema sp.]|nr:hypothetical protein [Treponema sp.]
MKIIFTVILCCFVSACGDRPGEREVPAGTPPSPAGGEAAGTAAAADTDAAEAETGAAAEVPGEREVSAGPPLPEPDFPFRFTLKAAPPETAVSFNGKTLKGQSAANGTAVYVIEKDAENPDGPGMV